MSTRCPAPCGGCALPSLQDDTSTSVEELRGHFTKEVLANVDSDSVTELFSRRDHMKVTAKGQATGFGLTSIAERLSAYALVRPPTVEEIWHVQKSERASVRSSGSFELEFYLGAPGIGSPQPDQRFGLVILIADFQPSATYGTLAAIPKGRPHSATYEFRVLRTQPKRP
jgi:hypothetical protein